MKELNFLAQQVVDSSLGYQEECEEILENLLKELGCFQIEEI